MKNIAVYGAGGLGREVAALIRQINKASNKWNFIGFIDDNSSLIGTSNEYGRIIGDIDYLNNFQDPLSVAIAVGNPKALYSITKRITNLNIDFPNLISPSATILDESNIQMGQGNIICSNCYISCNVRIGNFNIFNFITSIGHDASIGSYNVIMPSSNISGGDIIGDRNFLGVQSVVIQYLTIGNDTRIGANSVVMKSTEDGHLYFGNPARKFD